MAELKEMMRALMQQNVEERKEAKIARREAREIGWQVQRWATACRSLDLQVKELQKAVETLSQACSAVDLHCQA
jgi:predicted RNase H-like nuclease (RuvC/YqgF family)